MEIDKKPIFKPVKMKKKYVLKIIEEIFKTGIACRQIGLFEYEFYGFGTSAGTPFENYRGDIFLAHNPLGFRQPGGVVTYDMETKLFYPEIIERNS